VLKLLFNVPFSIRTRSSEMACLFVRDILTQMLLVAFRSKSVFFYFRIFCVLVPLTKHVHAPLSQLKTCTLTNTTIQNTYTFHCHNTKHVPYMYYCRNTHIHVTMLQYKTCTRNTHNTKCVHVLLSQYTCTRNNVTTPKHVHFPPSQYKTCTRATVTIQNMYTYYCHNTNHVNVLLSQYKTCTRNNVTIQNMYT
jgi:hypothetical protein